jgi:predicted HTH domain antitoxin
MNYQLTLDYPDMIPDVLQESRQQFEREAKMAMAVKLFELKRLSSGMAARLVGMPRADFLMQLHEFGVAMIDLEEQELETDVQNA